ncbi:hypothetical protein [Aquihabitans sp. McL0605]|uniref:hypothetical protein n=1 Tax=Aquihabitans sp. McL0605 TaxID=3415671 RepID=UPI003CE7BA82
MNEAIDSAGRPVVSQQVETRPTAGSAGLRIFQLASAIAGAVLFGLGLVAVFKVDFSVGLLDTSGSVANFGFSAAGAIAAILLGGAILVSALADQDRGATAFVGLVTIAVGIAALVVDGQADAKVQVDHRSAGLFIIVGAVAFVCSLMPWWSRRRTTTVVR